MLKLHYSSALSFNWQISGMERKNSQFSYWFWKKWKVSSPTKNNFFRQRNMWASDQAYDGGVIESKLPSPDVELMRYSLARPIPTYVVYYVLFSTRFYYVPTPTMFYYVPMQYSPNQSRPAELHTKTSSLPRWQDGHLYFVHPTSSSSSPLSSSPVFISVA